MFSIQPHVRRMAMATLQPGAPAPLPPPEADTAQPPPREVEDRTATLQILRCGAAASASMGVCFGFTFALTQQWRVRGGPVCKVASAWLIVGGAALTAYAEPLARQWTGARPTPWPRPSLARDALTPAVLLTTNLLYLYSRLPKFPAGSPQSWGTNLLLSSLGCGLAGALNETLARWEDSGNASAPAPARSPRQLAVGRSLSMVPMAMVQQVPAALLMVRSVPPALAPIPIIVGTGGWVFRRALAPEPRPGDDRLF